VINILFKIQFCPNICYFVNVLVYIQTYMQDVRKIIFFKLWNKCIILDSKIFQINEKICEQFKKMWFFKNAFKLKCCMEVFFDLLIKYRYFYIYNKTNLCSINLIFAFSELWIITKEIYGGLHFTYQWSTVLYNELENILCDINILDTILSSACRSKGSKCHWVTFQNSKNKQA